MKRKLTAVMIITAISFALGACSGGSSEQTDNTAAQTEEQTTESSNAVEEAEEEPEEEELTFETLNFGDSISTDFVEMTIDGASVSDEIEDDPFADDEENKKYFYLYGNIKNTSGDKLELNKSIINLCFDDKYNYEGRFVNISNNMGEIEPLNTLQYHICASVPDELIDSYSKCVFQIGLAENFNDYIYDMKDSDYLYEITVTK